MNKARLFILSAVAVIITTASTYAAPCESVASAGASTTYQKVDALLNEKIVATKLQAIGLTSQQAQARLSQLNERQLGDLAAQADMLQVGGTIQGADLQKHNPLTYIGKQFCLFFGNVYRLLFSWQDLK